MHSLKRLIPPPLRSALRKLANAFVHTETISESKDKWNKLAGENARYYVLTDYGKEISEEQFREAGKKDFAELILQDELLQKALSPLSDKTVLEIG